VSAAATEPHERGENSDERESLGGGDRATTTNPPPPSNIGTEWWARLPLGRGVELIA